MEGGKIEFTNVRSRILLFKSRRTRKVMEFSEFFKNVVHFYKNDFFTDVEISIFNTSSQEISSVCHCHKLVLASAIPQLKNILFSNEDSHIILQDIEISEVKSLKHFKL